MEQKSFTGKISGLGMLGPQAVGGIVPDGDGSLTRKIRDILDLAYTPTTECIVASCIDGRGPDSLGPELNGDGAMTSKLSKAPDAAGGTLALWVAFVLSGRDVPLEAFLKRLQKAGIPIGGHTDDHEHIGASGCGANDKLGHILELMSAGPSLARIVALTRELGVSVSESCVARLSKRADALNGSELLSTPVQRLALIKEYGSLMTLCKGHTEQLIVINTIAKTTLDRLSLKERLGGRAAVFNVDVWAFEDSLKQAATALDEEDESPPFETLYAAMLFYNLATALVLCAPSMPMALRSL
ncbi:MAG: cadmium-containing carbonic anhydrase [Coriobacteriales bacterium]|jgi:hypothetical protein|nr:cadmium-containing carbonic anhydrase [Coriobacteriales bacterium]